MSITNSVRMALTKAGKRQIDLANLYGWSKQSMSTKFSRDSWFGEDLAEVATFTGGKLAFVYPDGTVINIEGDPNKRRRGAKKEASDAATSEAEE